MEALGATPDARDRGLPGVSLLGIAQGQVPRHTILSEYHAASAVTACYMIRHAQYKYIHHVGMPPMLFDLATDPHERRDLARGSAYGKVLEACQSRLRAIVDPEAVDHLARADQRAYIEKHGGKEAILKKGTFRYSPPPGAKAAYYLKPMEPQMNTDTHGQENPSTNHEPATAAPS